MVRVLILIITFVCCAVSSANDQPLQTMTPVIFDTDMGNDVDDVIALAMLHSLQSRSECRLIAVTVSKENQMAAPFVDVINTFYGRGNIPLGVVRGGPTPDAGKYLQLVEINILTS